MEANAGLLPFLTKYGTNTISYAALHSNLHKWFDQKYGFASYASHLGFNYVLGRPLCSDKFLPYVIKSLTRELDSPAFVQVGEYVANVLHDKFNYKITQIGVERFLDIQTYNLDDSPIKGRLRASVRRGLETSKVYELDQEQLQSGFGVDQQNLEDFSADWLGRKTLKKPLRFLIRKPVYTDEPFIRKFYSFDKKNNLLGFVFFSPFFKNNQIIGYCTDIMRAASSAPYGHVAFIIMQALEKFKAEGKELLSLGLAPKVCVKPNYRNDWLTHRGLKLLYQYSNHFFDFTGIYNYKKQFGGITKPSFIATKRHFTLLESFALMNYMGFL